MFKHGNTIVFETYSREVRENRGRVPDGRNSIELRTRSAGNGRTKWCVKLTKGSLLYQLANRYATTNDAARDNSLEVESSTMLSEGCWVQLRSLRCLFIQRQEPSAGVFVLSTQYQYYGPQALPGRIWDVQRLSDSCPLSFSSGYGKYHST